jgi:RNA polymerase sigma-54 factor
LSFTLEMAMAPKVALDVSPAVIAFSEMLMLPLAAVQSVVDDELAANAALERLDADGCPVCRGSWKARCPVCSISSARGAYGSLANAPDTAVVEPDTHALLRAVRLEITETDIPVAQYVIDSFDEHGILDRSRAQLAAELGVDEATVSRVLAIIRRNGPPGIGATDVPECLLFQMDSLGLDDELARAVIACHLPALAKGHFGSIATALGVTRAEIEQVLDLIRRRLQPYPAFNGNSSGACSYIVPDVVVRSRDDHAGDAGAFTVELVEPAITRLGIRQRRRCSGGGALRQDAGASVARARSFLAQLHDRWETLRRIAEYAVGHQEEFLIHGPVALKPLTRAEVAIALDLHESTVSRAVADKYALLPSGTIVPLSRFFGVSGGIDEELRKLLESADGPMSDQRLAERLCEAGYRIARRTVAKHRARLGFAAAPLR